MKPSARRLLAKLPTMTGRQLARLAQVFLWFHHKSEPDLITLDEAIKLLPRHKGKKIHRSTIERWIQSGKLETVKLGGLRYTSRATLLAAMEPKPVRPAPSPVVTAAQCKKRASGLKAQTAEAMKRIQQIKALRAMR